MNPEDEKLLENLRNGLKQARDLRYWSGIANKALREMTTLSLEEYADSHDQVVLEIFMEALEHGNESEKNIVQDLFRLAKG